MIRTTLSALALLAFAATPALAAQCPRDAAAVDQALPQSTLSDAEKAEIKALRDQGMAAHDAGNHPEAEALLAEALKRLAPQ